jgi:hypothetical protein
MSARGIAQPRPANDRFRVIRTLRRHLGVTESDQTHLGHSRALGPDDPTRDPQQLANPQKKIANQSIVNLRPLEIYRMTGLGHLLDLCVRHHWSERLR